MKTAWTKGLNEKEATEISADFIAASHLRKRLISLLQEKERITREKLRSEALYEKPSWAYQQADGKGYERALNEIISLLE